MIWKKYLIPLMVLGILISILQYVGLKNEYYWNIWWFDIPMHALGGIWSALFVFWFHDRVNIPFKLTFFRIILGVLIIGLAWELWELAYGLTFVGRLEYLSDTLLDLLMDVVGGVITYFLYIKNRINAEQ